MIGRKKAAELAEQGARRGKTFGEVVDGMRKAGAGSRVIAEVLAPYARGDSEGDPPGGYDESREKDTE